MSNNATDTPDDNTNQNNLTTTKDDESISLRTFSTFDVKNIADIQSRPLAGDNIHLVTNAAKALLCSQLTQTSTVDEDESYNTSEEDQNNITSNKDLHSCITSTQSQSQMMTLMSAFDEETPSTHIFLKPIRGSLHSWEIKARNYLYVSVLNQFLGSKSMKKYQRMTINTNYKELCNMYMTVTGVNILPPFFQWNHSSKKYVKMSEEEICKYINTICRNVGRLKTSINKVLGQKRQRSSRVPIHPQEIIDLSKEVALCIPDDKRKELFDILSSLKETYCKKNRVDNT